MMTSTPEKTMVKNQGVKRYNLVLPVELFNKLEAVAERKGESVVAVLKQFIKLGLLAVELEDKPGAELVIKDADKETVLMPMW